MSSAVIEDCILLAQGIALFLCVLSKCDEHGGVESNTVPLKDRDSSRFSIHDGMLTKSTISVRLHTTVRKQWCWLKLGRWTKPEAVPFLRRFRGSGKPVLLSTESDLTKRRLNVDLPIWPAVKNAKVKMFV